MCICDKLDCADCEQMRKNGFVKRDNVWCNYTSPETVKEDYYFNGEKINGNSYDLEIRAFDESGSLKRGWRVEQKYADREVPPDEFTM